MKKIILVMSAVIFALFMGACSTKKTNSQKTSTGIEGTSIPPEVVGLDLVGKHWKLIELFGNPVIAENTPKEAYIIFNVDDNRFSGDAGCNRFSGSFQLKDPDRIVFSQTVSTRRMCINMDTEDKFLQVLNTADSYIIKNDILILNRARMAPLARFVAVDMK